MALGLTVIGMLVVVGVIIYGVNAITKDIKNNKKDDNDE